MSDKQQSVIDWLEKEYNLKCKLTPVDFYQAKELFKQQIIDTYEQGEEDGYWHHENGYTKKFNSAEQYYNDKFKTESK